MPYRFGCEGELTAGRPLREREGIVATAVGLVVAVVAFLRIPAADLGVVWAEDGAVFLTQRLAEGPFATWFSPYDGYLHLVPRILADLVVSVLPLEWFGVGIGVGTCLVAGAVGAFVFVASRDVVTPLPVPFGPPVRFALPARFLLAGLVVLLPTVSFEVLGNAANLHWLLLWLAPWLVLVRPRTRTAGALVGVLALVVGLSEIQAAVVLPFAVLPFLLLRWRERAGLPVRAALVLAFAVQLVTTLLSERAARPPVLPDVLSTVLGFAVNAVLMPFLGQHHAANLVLATGGWVAAAALALLAGALAVVLLRGGRVRAVAAGLLAWSAVVLWTAGFVLNPNPAFFYAQFGRDQWEALGPLRYGVVPAMCVLAIVILAITVLVAPAPAPARSGSGGRMLRASWIAGALAAVGAVALIAWQLVGSAGSSIRTSGPEWAETVRTGETACEAPDAPEELALPVHPPTWSATVACALLAPTPAPTR
ncbi:hypothetical protein N1028_06935 [Herbiconiux sp. CPCC 203407]|uniref:Uncharacterized protein n=1 Tax=Herbiconiux oxytropis TaxID=2970915 RepID=A0AA41XH74_9MICO|nr:hypothetical protein [Herbiconiux oxytropis]MCS5722045.1 hypothetical protein [Herbiconiux oxytropis]MCS5725628.1 hypothetical protein [Herbiconiux oxytropis]